MNTILVKSGGVHNDIEEILGLKEMSAEEQQLFLENVGALIIESAVLKYIVGLDSGAREQFEAWLEDNQKGEALLELALEKYSDFAEILTEEMSAFQSEAFRLFGATV